jgi:hypothetical protein
MSSDELYEVFTECFSSPLDSEDAAMLNGLWSVHGQYANESMPEFLQAVFAGDTPSAKGEFYSKIDSKLRFSFLREFYKPRGSGLNLGYTEGSNTPVSLDRDMESVNWVSILGGIGSGKSFTKEMILSQVLANRDGEVVIFDPLLDADFYSAASSERVSQFTEAADMDVLVDSFVEYVEDRVENSDSDIYVIVDEAGYILDSAPEEFKRMVEHSHTGEVEMLVTSLQGLDDSLISNDLACAPLWVFHKSDISSKIRDRLGVSERIESLQAGTATSYSEAILKRDGELGVVCDVTPRERS